MLFLKRSSNNSNFSFFPSNVGIDVVRALGIGGVVLTSVRFDEDVTASGRLVRSISGD